MSDGEEEGGALQAEIVKTEETLEEVFPIFNKYRKGQGKKGVKVTLKASKEFLRARFQAKDVVVITAFTGGSAEGEEEDEDEEEKAIHGFMLLQYRPNALTLGRDLFLTDEYVSPILSAKMKRDIGAIMCSTLVKLAKELDSKTIYFDSQTESQRTQQLIDVGFGQETSYHFVLSAGEAEA